MAARSWVRCELQENLSSALLHVNVLDAFAGTGIGRALLEHAEALAAADGRTILQTFTEHPADFDVDGPNVIRPATGTGALPAGAPGVRFAEQAGYRLEQVERFSSLDIPPAADLDTLERDALASAGDYELLHWTDSCPEEHADQLAVLMSRMSTDAPTGALSYEPEIWDVARVRHVEDTWRRAGQSSLVVAARHRATGELAAYTVLQTTADKPWLADQDDTLVAAGHRGHRLGMLIKIHNLRLLREGYPAVRRVLTYQRCRKRSHAQHQHRAGVRAGGLRRRVAEDRCRRGRSHRVLTPGMTGRRMGQTLPGAECRGKLPGVTNGTGAQTSICWRLKARFEPGRTDGGWHNGWDDALYGKRCTD